MYSIPFYRLRMRSNGIFLYLLRQETDSFRIPVCDHGVSLSCEGRPDPKKCVWMAHGIFLVLMMLEEWIITQKIGESSHDMYLMTPLVTANLFLAAAFVPVVERMGAAAKTMRELSTEIFLLHMLVYFWYKKIMECMGLDAGNHLVRYMVVVTVSVLIGLILIYIRRKRSKQENYKKI